MNQKLVSSTREVPSHDPSSILPVEGEDRHPRLEDYLDHVFAELVDAVPYQRRRELRAELASHLDSLVEAHLELGEEPEVAVTKTLERFGAARELGRAWLEEWRPRPYWPLHRAFLAALPVALFSTLGCWNFAMANVRWIELPGAIHYFGMLVPALTGFLGGFVGRANRAAGTCLALALCTLLTLGLSRFVGEQEARSLVELTMAQFFLWLPIGICSAEVGGWARDRRLPRIRRRWTMR